MTSNAAWIGRSGDGQNPPRHVDTSTRRPRTCILTVEVAVTSRQSSHSRGVHVLTFIHCLCPPLPEPERIVQSFIRIYLVMSVTSVCTEQCSAALSGVRMGCCH